jgi:hypothetical protein
MRCAGLCVGRCAGIASLLLPLLLLGGCSNDNPDGGADGDAGVTIRLVIPDGNIRKPNVPCEGAGAYRFAHPAAPFVIQDAAGEPVASGALPQGVAEPAWNIDLGDRRQPTVCVMLIDVAELDTVDGLSLVIDGRQPKPITLNRNLDDAPEVVLS